MSARIPWRAALLSLALPGLGQLYNAQINRGIWFFLAYAVLLIPGTTLASLYLPPVLMIPVFVGCFLLGLTTWIAAVIDAYLQARKLREFSTKPWQSVGLYTLVLVVFSFVLLPLIINYVRQHQVQTFSIASGSMNPTLVQGDYVFADMRYNCPMCKVEVARGDVAIFVYPNNRNHYYIKRIIGLPGDRVQFSSKGVLVNGEALAKGRGVELLNESLDDNAWSINDKMKSQDTIDTVVPSGHVFVLGDNRNNSRDSREFGNVPLVDVVGKARQVWLSRTATGINWGRIGELVQ